MSIIGTAVNESDPRFKVWRRITTKNYNRRENIYIGGSKKFNQR